MLKCRRKKGRCKASERSRQGGKVKQVDVFDFNMGIKWPKYALMKAKINVISKL